MGFASPFSRHPGINVYNLWWNTIQHRDRLLIIAFKSGVGDLLQVSFFLLPTISFADSLPSSVMDLFGFADSMTLGEAPDGLTAFIRQVNRDNRRNYPVYLTEWNNTPSQQDLLNDTCFKSCYFTKEILENMDALEGFCCWSLTDMMGEAPVAAALFSGGLGLFTRNGIPKASYCALTLLSRLGNSCLGHGDGWYITRNGGEYQILLYNYRHFSHLYALGERFDMTFTDRYTPFSPEQFMEADITLSDIPDGDYIICEQSVSRKQGSAFDQWVSMGALELEPYEMPYLERRSSPSLTKYTVRTENGVLKLGAMLELLEVRLLVVKPSLRV